MRLLVDIGNTSVKWMAADERWQLMSGGILADDCWRNVVEQHDAKRAIVCATGKAERHLEELAALGVEVRQVDADSVVRQGALAGIDYATPATLGQDRIVAACGAWNLCRRACVVIDAGTCITIDYIDAQGIYRGGAILPSAELQLLAMHQHTARLPLPEIDYTAYYQPLGRSTNEALLDGAICGTRYAVEGMVDHYRRQNNDIAVIYTGGVGEFVCGQMADAEYRPTLVFEGLAAIGRMES